MGHHTAITSDFWELRRLLMLFDRIGLRGLDTLVELSAAGLDSMNTPPFEALHSDLVALASAGLIFQPEEEVLRIPTDPDDVLVQEPSEDAEVSRLASELHAQDFAHLSLVFKRAILQGQRKGHLKNFKVSDSLIEVDRRLESYHKWSKPLETRLIAARLRAQGQEVFPIVDIPSDSSILRSKEAVLEVVLSGLPVVDDGVSIADLIDFKSDSESRHQLLALRRWIRSISDLKLSAGELKDEIEWCIAEHRKHMQAHRVRATRGLLKITLKCPLELAENLVRLRLSKTIDAFFEIQQIRASLLEAELAAPGRELAYMVRVHREFSGSEV